MKNIWNRIRKVNIRKICTGLCFFVFLWFTYLFVRAAIVDTDSSTRLALHDFYKQDNIDMAVVGSSRVYRGFYPELADNLLDVNTFNMGTTSQTFDGSFYYTKELLKRYNPETVYLSVEFDFLRREVGGQKATWIISDYMKGFTRYQYIFDLFEKEELPIMLSGIYRYKSDISLEWCKRNIKAKLNKDYLTYRNKNDIYINYNAYIGKGLARLDKDYEGYTFFAFKETASQFDVVSPELWDSEAIQYLTNTIEMCQRNGVEIVLITMPVSNFYLSHAGDYQVFSDYVNEIANKYEIEYYDFNLLDGAPFDDSEFANLDHLTISGAQHFTELLCQLHKDRSSLKFVDSLEKVGNEGVIGITYKLEKIKSSKYHLSWNIESFEDEDYYVKVIEKVDGETVYESDLLSTDSVDYTVKTGSITILEVYDSNMNYLGNAVLQ